MADDSGSQRYIFKIILMGDYAVGKTCIIRRYVSDTFLEEYKASIGVDITSQQLSYGTEHVQLQLWDMSGQTDFRMVRSQFMAGTDLGVIVFDLTRPSSLENIDRWISEILTHVQDLPMVLIGNKSDLTSERLVESKAGQRAAKERKMLFYAETSAKSGTNIQKIFQDMGRQLIDDVRTKRG